VANIDELRKAIAATLSDIEGHLEGETKREWPKNAPFLHPT
jgi:hypothetical protein